MSETGAAGGGAWVGYVVNRMLILSAHSRLCLRYVCMIATVLCFCFLDCFASQAFLKNLSDSTFFF